MTETVQHKNIYTALAAAQSAMGPVVKGAINPAFKSKYADLADVVAAVLPPLNSNGIAYFSHVVDGAMRTVLMHGESETSIACDVPLLVNKQDMQGFKSATTYAKRIGIESLTGVAPEDDDGNAAANNPPKTAKKAPHETPEAGSMEAALNPAEQRLANLVGLLDKAATLAELQATWSAWAKDPVTATQDAIRAKDINKDRLSRARISDAIGGDEIPY